MAAVPSGPLGDLTTLLSKRSVFSFSKGKMFLTLMGRPSDPFMMFISKKMTLTLQKSVSKDKDSYL